MIEHALRSRLQPVVDRRRHVALAWRLALVWSLLGLAGLGLFGIDWLWGWRSPVLGWVVLVLAVAATLWVLRTARRAQPDYTAIAHEIEQHHPDLKALLLAAVEQRPKGPDGQWGYLQEWVVLQAISHAMNHDWAKSVSDRWVWLARVAGVAALVFLAAVLSRTGLFGPVPGPRRGVLRAAAYSVTVTPGDTTVEQGSPVVVVARFDGRVPVEATLEYGPAGGPAERMELTQTLGDPVFGGIIQAVRSDLVYRIEYAGRTTRDYTIQTYEHPSLTRADARIVYPAYTQLPEKVLLDTRRVSAVEGSRVTWTLTLNKPVTTAQLVPSEGPALDLLPEGPGEGIPDPRIGSAQGPNTYTVSLTAAQTQRWGLRLIDPRGRTNKVPDRFVLEVQKNLAPSVRPVFPNQDVQVSPLEELDLEAEVSDDFGLIRHGLTYAVAGAADQEVTLGGTSESKAKQKARFLLALEDLKAEPDQLLTYSFWAEDAGPDGATRRTVSDIYFVEVRSFEEIFRESESFQDPRGQEQRDQDPQGQQGQEQDRPEQLIRLQKQIITATWNVKQKADAAGGVDSVKEDLDVVRESQADALSQAQSASAEAEDAAAAKALKSAAGHMETSVRHLSQARDSASAAELAPALGAEQAAYQELLRMRSREFQVAQSRNASRRNSTDSARFERQLEQLELRQQENRYETQRLAQSQEQGAAREDLQVLNRLRDLAQRQADMTDRLREAEASLQQARTDQERQEIDRQLQRLRDEQMEALQGVDELQQRMERSENRQRMTDAREQLADSRSRIRQSAEEIEQGQVSRAATSTTRAQRGLEQMQDQFRRSTSSQFSEEVRQMRDEAQDLDQRQRRISDQLREQVDAGRKTLADSGATGELTDELDQQKERVQVLIDQMKDVSDRAETAEPLLSRTLYDTLRRASTENLDRSLDVASELLSRNFLEQAQEFERQAGQGIQDLRRGVEEAARDVLGDETEALRLAREQLDDLIRQVSDEAAQAGRTGPGSQTDPNQRPSLAADGQGSETPPDTADPSRPQGRTGDRSATGRAQGRPADQAQEGQSRAPGARTAQARTGAPQADPAGGGGLLDPVGGDPNAQPGPLTGQAFRAWSDRLRDVEETLSEEDLRNEAARVRDRARAIRAEFTRHGKEPQWDVVADQIVRPLTEVRRRVAERLAQLGSDEAMVQIDRDPVPGRFAEAVRRYFENLGGSEP